MSDDQTAEGSAGARCPWCSAELPSTNLASCPSCGATLMTDGEPQVPGVTAIDPVAVIEGAREPRRPRNRLIAWLSGDTEEPPSPAGSDALAPPSPDVRREILRLQMAAQISELSAEAEAMASAEAIAAQASGDTAAAHAAVEAVVEADARTDELIASAEATGAPVPAEGSASADQAPGPDAAPETSGEPAPGS